MNSGCMFFALVVFVCGGVIGACATALMQINRPMPEQPAEDSSLL